MDHSVVQRWLRGVVTQYPESDKVYADTDRTLTSVSSLFPKTEIYTYDDGRTQLLIQLTGTIPIQFRNSTYNIPVSIWIQRAYPREPPIVYVTPTNDMLVRKGKHVDVSGRVEGGYLEAWSRKFEGCNLLSLVHDLQDIFGREPPVYAKPAGAPSPQVQRASTSSPSISSPRVSETFNPDPRERGPPMRPPPVGHSRQDFNSGGVPASPNPSISGAPAPPPKAGQASRQSSLNLDPTFRQQSPYQNHQQFQPQPHPQSQPETYSNQNGHSYQSTTTGPQLQPHPQAQFRHPQSSPQNSQTFHSQSPRPDPSQPGPSRSNSLDPRDPRNQFSAPCPGSGSAWAPLTHQSHPQQQPQHPYQPQPQTFDRPQQPSFDQQVAPPPLPPQPRRQEDLLDSLESSTSDSSQLTSGPAPPRPLNPELLALHTALYEKINSRYFSLQQTLNSANSQLEVLQSDLSRGEPAIRDEMKRLEAVRDVCRTRRERLEELHSKGEERYADLKKKEEPEMEGIVCATSIVGNQLLDLVAEDNAIEDTIYHLGRALNSERIDLASFLKQTRYLAREQFMRRALSLKIAEGMGWSSDGRQAFERR